VQSGARSPNTGYQLAFGCVFGKQARVRFLEQFVVAIGKDEPRSEFSQLVQVHVEKVSVLVRPRNLFRIRIFDCAMQHSMIVFKTKSAKPKSSAGFRARTSA
jgi:hypothetical protein